MSLKQRREAEYRRWVDAYADPLFRFACRLCGSRHLAEDLVQETFYHAWRSMSSLRQPKRARAWLFQILRHRWSHQVRWESRRPQTGPPLDGLGPRPDGRADDPAETLGRRDEVQQALASLEDRYRIPLLLVYLQGMTCQEAADKLDVPLGTILSRLHRARKILKRDRREEDQPRQAGNPAPVAGHDQERNLRLRRQA